MGAKMADFSDIRQVRGSSLARELAKGISLIGLIVGGFSVTAIDAYANDYKTPPRLFRDPLGIDLPSNGLFRDDTFLTIGDAAGGLTWTYHAGHYQGKLLYSSK